MCKIKVNGEINHLIRTVYDFFRKCTWYFVEEKQEPINDVENKIEVIPK